MSDSKKQAKEFGRSLNAMSDSKKASEGIQKEPEYHERSKKSKRRNSEGV
ncbi:hypothetical protein [Gracilibacillus oryzae]|nr:hypothetical protein [Gracilibacillus oryzae]